MTWTLSRPGKLLSLFALSTGVMLAAIGWLGWRLLIQERALDEQRLRDQLENTASLASRELDRALTAWVDRLSLMLNGKDVNDVPADNVAILFDSNGVLRHTGRALPFYPRVARQHEADRSVFDAAEVLEFSRNELQGAEQTYRRLTVSADPAVRAAALLRLARVLRREQRPRDAIAVYADLVSVGQDVWVAAAPAELVARRERIALFEAIDDRLAAAQEAARLGESLWSGRYLIDRTTFDFYRESATTPATIDDRVSLAEHIEKTWPVLERQDSGRLAIADGPKSFLEVWNKTDNGSAVMIGSLDSIAATLSALSPSGATVGLEDDTGHLVWGRESPPPMAVRTSRQTGLPWTLKVAATDSSATQQLLRSRRTLLIAGLLLTLVLVATSGAVMFRAVNREFNVARLQSDFVATVSHEFRTPLTAMRHLTEMLDEGEVAQERVPHYYKALVKETRRLQALVESLLDFGRMEAGRRTYRMEKCDACEVVRQVLDDLSDSVHGRRIEWDPARVPGARAPVRVDREAMGLAVRNLVDNALKYSPESAPVRVSVGADSTAATISVADRGPGIADGEQREIFRKFVRGAAALDGRVNGTGIGLAIADHIVQAHGGQLRLESAPGQGSCFSIVLPLVAEAA
jgi:two-component system, OmpR family, phosphate regulon sensor histidine kinase PhoR